MTEELIVLFLLLFLLFGPKKLPEIARYVGKIVGEYRRYVREIEKELNGK